MNWQKVIQEIRERAEWHKSEGRRYDKNGDLGLSIHHLKRCVNLQEQAEFLAAGLSEVETGGVYSGGEGHETR